MSSSKLARTLAAVLLVLGTAPAALAQLTPTYTFTAGTVINPDQVNANFNIFLNALDRRDGIVTSTITIPNTGLHLLDTNATHDLIVVPGSNLTADRQLTITTGDAARTVTLSGSPTLDDWFNQAVKSTSSPTFAALTVTTMNGFTFNQSVASGASPTFAALTVTTMNTFTFNQSVANGASPTFTTVTANLTGNVTGNVSGTSGSTTGNAATATALQNARTIGGVSFNGTANITVATATGGFTVSGGDLALGTNSLTLTGSIASTGSRVTKGWFTDLESTNTITGSVSGTAATVTSATQAAITTTANLTTVGALGTGSIGTGFGAINVGADAITGGAFSGTTMTMSDDLIMTNSGFPTIRTATSDAADNKTLTLASAGAAGASRGAFINLFGNESGSPGKLQLLAGNVTGGVIEVLTGNAVLQGTMHLSGGFSWGDATDPGDDNFRVAGAITQAGVGSNAFTGKILSAANVELNDFAAGTGNPATAGFVAGRNTSGSGAAGVINLHGQAGASNFLWGDSSAAPGMLRIGATAPVEDGGTTSDRTGTIVGTQTSTLDTKDLLGDDLTPADALGVILRTSVKRFRYKGDNAYGGTIFNGIIADWSPEFAMDPDEAHPNGRSFNPVSAFGFSVLAFQALGAEQAALAARVAALEKAAGR